MGHSATFLGVHAFVRAHRIWSISVCFQPPYRWSEGALLRGGAFLALVNRWAHVCLGVCSRLQWVWSRTYVESNARCIGGRRRPYHVECTGSLPTSEIKRRRARLIPGWGNAWAHNMMLSALTVYRLVRSGFRILWHTASSR